MKDLRKEVQKLEKEFKEKETFFDNTEQRKEKEPKRKEIFIL